MNSITIGREYYHLHQTLMEWCRRNVGNGGWKRLVEDENSSWVMEVMFGYATFEFTDSASKEQFEQMLTTIRGKVSYDDWIHEHGDLSKIVNGIQLMPEAVTNGLWIRYMKYLEE